MLLQRFLVDCPTDRRGLYWHADVTHAPTGPRPTVEPRDDGGLTIAPGALLNFDTYFNSFFEQHWRRNTTLGAVVLRLSVLGSGLLRVFRRAANRKVLVHEEAVSSGPFTLRLPGEAITLRLYGTLCVELHAQESELVFVAGGWWSDGAAPAKIGLAAVFCTYNREADITRLLGTLADDPVATARLARLYVVNQGRPGLGSTPALKDVAERLGDRLVFIEQGNFGGAGGFGRGILAALDDPAATHAALLDDDILLEPDSLLRMAAFFAFCRRDILIGGHMLDLAQPNNLYEAGAIVSDRHWEFWPQHSALDIDNPRHLERLSTSSAVHYNAWWCCGIPLALVREHGMPLPCFIRGDDVEYGLRFHQLGIPTLAMPGIAVWHEPFYLKFGGWQRYYETRNLMVLASLHLEADAWGMVRRIGRHVVLNLLTFRYYTTAVILEAAEDFLRGPAVMAAHPAARHASLAKLSAAYPTLSTPRETVLEPQTFSRSPRGSFACLVLMIRLLVRNAIAPTTKGTARRLDLERLHWLSMRGVEHVAVQDGWEDALPTFHRSREQHRTLLRWSLSLLPRLYRGMPAAAAAWRQEVPRLTSEAFWRDYLAVPPQPAELPPVRTPDQIASVA